VILANKTFKHFKNAEGNEMIKFLSAAIGKIMKTSLETGKKENLLLLSKYVMKHIKPISEMHQAIMREIVDNFQNPHEQDILFFYLLQVRHHDNGEYNNFLEALFENFRSGDRVDLLIDLYFSFEDDRGKIEDVLAAYLRDKVEISARSLFFVCKFLLFKPIRGVLKHVFAEYYIGSDESLHQFLIVFLHEFSKNNLQRIFDEFEQIFNFITQRANDKVADTNKIQKTFINQILNKIECGDQLKDFVLKVSVFLMRQWNDNLANVVMSAERGDWDVSFVKKIIFCLSKVAKNVDNRQLKVFLLEMMGQDDGEPISHADLEDVKRRMDDN
ncbi:hypothetical protein EQH57_0798, partial [Dictyocoela roeselum]